MNGDLGGFKTDFAKSPLAPLAKGECLTPPAALIGVLVSQVFLRCLGFEKVV